MHTGELYPEFFEFQIDGADATFSDILPAPSRFDRFGLVLNEPFGSLGASLLMQAGIANWFEARPQRRDSTPVYPEVYLFHFGGAWGDHQCYDFWPTARKEIVIPDGDPIELLNRINGSGITRLAIPEGPLGDLKRLTWGWTTWGEQSSAIDRLRSCFAYSPSGNVSNPDLSIREKHPRLESSPVQSLDVQGTAQELIEMEANNFVGALPGDSVPADNYRGVFAMRRRWNEVPKETTDRLRAERAELRKRTGGVRVETFRRLDVNETLQMIAGLDPHAVL